MKILQLEGRFLKNSAIPVVFKFGKKHVSETLFLLSVSCHENEWSGTIQCNFGISSKNPCGFYSKSGVKLNLVILPSPFWFFILTPDIILLVITWVCKRLQFPLNYIACIFLALFTVYTYAYAYVPMKIIQLHKLLILCNHCFSHFTYKSTNLIISDLELVIYSFLLVYWVHIRFYKLNRSLCDNICNVSNFQFHLYLEQACFFKVVFYLSINPPETLLQNN